MFVFCYLPHPHLCCTDSENWAVGRDSDPFPVRALFNCSTGTLVEKDDTFRGTPIIMASTDIRLLLLGWGPWGLQQHVSWWYRGTVVVGAA